MKVKDLMAELSAIDGDYEVKYFLEYSASKHPYESIKRINVDTSKQEVLVE